MKTVKRVILFALILLTLCAFPLAAGAGVENQAQFLSAVKTMLGEYEALNPAQMGEIPCGLTALTAKENFFVAHDNGDGTFTATFHNNGAAFRYPALSRPDALKLTYCVSSSYLALTRDESNQSTGDLTVYLDAAVLGEASPTMGKDFTTVFSLLDTLRALLKAEGVEAYDLLKVGGRDPSAGPGEAVDALRFNVEYAVAYQRLQAVRSLFQQYPTEITGITEDRIAGKTDVQLYGVPIASMREFFDKETPANAKEISFHVADAAPQRFDNLQQSRQNALNAFIKLYNGLREQFGDPGACSVRVMENYKTVYYLFPALDKPETLGEMFLRAETCELDFAFGSFTLHADSGSGVDDSIFLRTVGFDGAYNGASAYVVWSKNGSYITNHGDEEIPSRFQKAFKPEDYGADALPRIDPRVDAVYEQCLAGEKLPKPKAYSLKKVGAYKALNAYYHFYDQFNADYADGNLAELDLCKAKLFGVRIDHITDLFVSGSIKDDLCDLRFVPKVHNAYGYGLTEMFQCLYTGMKSSLGKPTGYWFEYEGTEYQLPENPDFAQLAYLFDTYSHALLEYYFGNYTLRYAYSGADKEITVDYTGERGVYRTVSANRMLPLVKLLSKEDYAYAKPAYDKERVETYRERYFLLRYFYGVYDPDAAYGSGKDFSAFLDLKKTESANPLDIGSTGRYGKDECGFTIAVELRNSSKLRRVTGCTLAVYCEDIYGDKVYPYYGDYALYDVNREFKPGGSGFTKYLILDGVYDPKYIYVAVQKVQMENGTTYTIPDKELHYYYWTR